MNGPGLTATAEEITQAKLAMLGTLVAGIAHELNTPLGALHGNHDVIERALSKLGKILEDGVVAADELVQLRRIVQACESVLNTNQVAIDRMVSLVQRLREFGRPKASAARPVDLHEGIEGTLALLGYELQQVDVLRDYGHLPPVICVPSRVNQVFMNLVHNSAQAMPDGGSLTIRTRAERKRVHIRVSDTGPGIRREVAERIFEPGFTTKGDRIGMGLGLAIAFQIIDQHGGSISVESGEGKGATFDVHLPVWPKQDPLEKEEQDARL